MPDPDEIAAAADRLRQNPDHHNLDQCRRIYGKAPANWRNENPEPVEIDGVDYTYTGTLEAIWYGQQIDDDRKLLADAYLAEHDPTPLTLDVLRQELGEPHYDGVESPGSTVNRKQWHVCDGKEMIWLESRRRWPVWRWQELHTLGQLRRILSVIREQEG